MYSILELTFDPVYPESFPKSRRFEVVERMNTRWLNGREPGKRPASECVFW